MANGPHPTTDYGTVIFHWIMLIAIIVLLATGLRIASDDPHTLWLATLDPVLPMEHLWFRHVVAGVVLVAALSGYILYIRSARLFQRIRVDRARMSALTRGGKAAIGAINGLVLWALLGALVLLIVTGVMLFLGIGQGDMSWHMWATWVLLGAAGLHIGLHAAYGGTRQLLRIVRPSRLIVAPPPPDFAALLAEKLMAERLRAVPPATVSPAPTTAMSASARKTENDGLRQQANKNRPADRTVRLRTDAVPQALISGCPGAQKALAHRKPPKLYTPPIVTALAGGFVVLLAAAQFESATRKTLHVAAIPADHAPALDGDLSDLVWRNAPAVSVLTTQGGDFGGSGESLVEVRALHDDTYAYFSFVWSDPTRSLKHLPLIKTNDGWRMARSGVVAGGSAGEADDPLEDKFAVMLARSSLPLIGAAIHLSPSPLASKPPGRGRRGLHYTDGTIADVWQWRASHDGIAGYIENCHFGGPAQAAGDGSPLKAEAYSGGFMRDPEIPVWVENVATEPDPASLVLQPKRLPRDPRVMMQAMGPMSDDTRQSERENTRWWMTESESVPYPASGTDTMPVGSVIPSVVMLNERPGEKTSIRGVARWAAGRWTLELARKLDTGSPNDLPIRSGMLMWVAAFDHAETRHTRHLRPLLLEVE